METITADSTSPETRVTELPAHGMVKLTTDDGLPIYVRSSSILMVRYVGDNVAEVTVGCFRTIMVRESADTVLVAIDTAARLEQEPARPDEVCSPEAAEATCPCGGFYVYCPSSSSQLDTYACHDCGQRP